MSSMQRRARPSVEILEDRLAPATFKVSTFADIVSNGGKLSLREAITKANATEKQDTIKLKAGEYRITIPGMGEDGNATGDFDVTQPLIIKGKTATASIIDGNDSDRVFDVLGTYDITFSKVTIRNGAVQGNGGAIHALDANILLSASTVSGNFGVEGGGIFAMNGNVMLSQSTVRDNVGSNGGGIFAENGDVTLEDSTVSGNGATSDGGGIAAGGGEVTLNNSTVSDNDSAHDGGGIFNRDDGKVTLAASIVSSNLARLNGGGIYSFNGDVTLLGSNVTDNETAFGRGGGIAVTGGDLTLTNSSVSDNKSRQAGGGGIYAEGGDATLRDSTVSGNEAGGSCGGISAFTGLFTLDRSTVHGNQAAGAAGGLCFDRGTIKASTISANLAGAGGAGGIYAGIELTITNSTIHGNLAAVNAGGLYVESTATATLRNVTLSHNIAGKFGGGLYNLGLSTLTNVTVTGNIAESGGGIYNAAENTPLGSFHVKNTIIALNLANAGAAFGPDAYAHRTITTDGHNLVGIGEGSLDFISPSDLVGNAANPLDPKLDPLADNGGPTHTHALLPGSLALDNAAVDPNVTTDQREIRRSRDGDGNGSILPDIGAFER